MISCLTYELWAFRALLSVGSTKANSLDHSTKLIPLFDQAESVSYKSICSTY